MIYAHVLNRGPVAVRSLLDACWEGGVSAGAEAGRTHRAIPGQGSLANMHGAGALERAKLPE